MEAVNDCFVYPIFGWDLLSTLRSSEICMINRGKAEFLFHIFPTLTARKIYATFKESNQDFSYVSQMEDVEQATV